MPKVRLNSGTVIVLPENIQSTYDIYKTFNANHSINQKIYKLKGTQTVVFTVTYNYQNGRIISKIIT